MAKPSTRLALTLVLLSCACKQPLAAPANPPPAHPAHAEQVAAPTPEAPTDDPPPPHDPFALDEDADDPAAALESMRHNCCDEMPADELRKHTGGASAH